MQTSPIYQEIFASQLGNGFALAVSPDISSELKPVEAVP
jgi:hypothetical protein